jgi:hypothetical protein
MLVEPTTSAKTTVTVLRMRLGDEAASGMGVPQLGQNFALDALFSPQTGQSATTRV